MANSVFTPRLTRPEAGNPYYNTRAKGGYSNAIKGSPTDAGCDVLSNCVGYAYGRFNEIGGWGSCKYLVPTNAENFIQNTSGLEVGLTPRIGACAVWRKGATLSGSDGAGHVAIVEKVLTPTQIITSESGWGSATPFYTKTRNKGADGNWGAGAGYTFLGFIYNPAPCCKEPAQDSVTSSGSGTISTGSSAGPTGEQCYTVKRGDTLGAIAAKYGIPYMEIAKYNGISNPNYLYVGQLLRIPGKDSTAAPAESAPEKSAGDWVPQKGDRVRFNGNAHYDSAYSTRPVSCTGGLAKITLGPFQLGQSKHPYHLVSVEPGCTVYGWVDEGSFTKA